MPLQLLAGTTAWPEFKLQLHEVAQVFQDAAPWRKRLTPLPREEDQILFGDRTPCHLTLESIEHMPNAWVLSKPGINELVWAG